jgi:hypothetical protein
VGQGARAVYVNSSKPFSQEDVSHASRWVSRGLLRSLQINRGCLILQERTIRILIRNVGLRPRRSLFDMSDTWITDIRHYLDPSGHLPSELPGPALNLALFLGSIIEWMTSQAVTSVERTNVCCRRSPGRRRCPGKIIAVFEEDTDVILWRCPLCGDNGYIRGWRGTLWDRSGGKLYQPLD